MVDATGGQDDTRLPHASPEVLLRTLADLIDEAVVSCDIEFRITSFNKSAERLFGRSPDGLVGGEITALFPSHLREEMAAMCATVAAGELTRKFEAEIVRPDGLPVPVSLSMAPVADESGTIIGSMIVARDVTEQHLAQATLAEIDSRLEEGEALSHVGSWLWDVRTGAVQWSFEFHRIHDIDPLDFAGTFESYMGLIADGDLERVRAAMTESVHDSRPLDLEYRVLDSDQKTRVIRVTANPTIGLDGNAVGLRGIGQDVTDQSGSQSR